MKNIHYSKLFYTYSRNDIIIIKLTMYLQKNNNRKVYRNNCIRRHDLEDDSTRKVYKSQLDVI